MYNCGLTKDELRDLAAHNTVVFVHGYEPNPWATMIRADFRKGALLAMRHLLGLGHRRIGYVTRAIAQPWLTSRFDGYWSALKNARVGLDWKLVAETMEKDSNATTRAMQALWDQPDPPSALFVNNDAQSLYALNYYRARGIHVPRDISIVGFDDIPEAARADPPLTTVRPHWYKMGALAMQTLARYTAHGQRHEDLLVAPELVVRATTRAPATAGDCKQNESRAK